VIEEAERTWLQVNVVERPDQTPRCRSHLRILSPAHATKRLSLRKQSSLYDFVWEQWSDYQGYPDLAKGRVLKKAADAAHSKGRSSASTRASSCRRTRRGGQP